jgi:hypothetical protein
VGTFDPVEIGAAVLALLAGAAVAFLASAAIRPRATVSGRAVAPSPSLSPASPPLAPERPIALAGPFTPVPRASGPPGAEHDLALAGIGAAIREPLVRASTAASMLRLVLPAPPVAAERELLRLEEELAVAERRLAALVAAGERGRRAPRALDLAAVAAEVARTLSLPGAIRVRWPAAAGEPVVALGDEGRLRPALREAIRGSAATLLPHGGEVRLRAGQRGGEVTLEIAADGVARARDPWLPFVRALLGPAGARVEEESLPGRGTVCRIVLPAAPSDVLEDAEIRLISEP